MSDIFLSCPFLHGLVGSSKDLQGPLEPFKSLSGFVNFELVTLEERRLITTKLYTTAQDANDDGESFITEVRVVPMVFFNFQVIILQWNS